MPRVKKVDQQDADERIIEIEMERLRSFENHPFKVQADSQMIELQDSIKKYGIINPLIVRPLPDGVYEIISGHRRKYAAERLGYRKVPTIIRVMQDDEAVVSMVDSNLQREQISPSEKAFAYKMKYDAIKRKTGRRKCGQVDHHSGRKSIEIIGEESGDSPKQVQRYLKITELIPELLEKVDDGSMGFTPAVQLSYLKKEEQKEMIEAKVLYGLMLDRMSLSVKNQWLDAEGKAGLGLIEKKRQGQGRPTMIYVKQFVIRDIQKCNNYTSEEKPVIPEVKKVHILKCENAMSRSEENTLPEVKNIHTNKNNINNTDFNNTESNLIVSESDGMRSDMDSYAELIKDNLELDILRERHPYDRELIDGIFDLILEIVLCRSDNIIIASNKYPAALVKGKLLKLNSSHIEYALDCMKANTTKVHNIKKYLIATLFNAPSTISGYYQAEVNHDMPQLAAF